MEKVSKVETQDSQIIENINEGMYGIAIEHSLEGVVLAFYTLLALLLNNIRKNIKTNNKLIESFKTTDAKKFTEEDKREINDLLEEILIKSKANRLMLCFYHNGQALFNKYSFVKFSACFEVVEEGREKLSRMYKDVPVTLLDVESFAIDLWDNHKDKKVVVKILNRELNRDSIFWIKDIDSYLLIEIEGSNVFHQKKGFLLCTYDDKSTKELEKNFKELKELKELILNLEVLL